MKKILIIDDEQDICLLLDRFLTKKGFQVFTALNGKTGIELLKKEKIDLVLCDFRLPKYTGIEILQQIKIINPSTQVIIITGYSDVKIAVEALKKGAFDYVTKPLYPDEILATINKSLQQTAPSLKSKKTNKKASSTTEFVSGTSDQAVLVNKHINLIAPTDMSVIILGETGTGKEYIARQIHTRSKRAKKPFIAVDCGALPENLAESELFGHVKGSFTGALADKVGSFELANEGTLFLDEFGNLTYDNQVKLLRVLQERVIKKVGATTTIPVDIRLIVATNENLQESIEEGKLREDIYHRLNEFKIQLSPLRERPDDIAIYANYFMTLASQQLDKSVIQISEKAMDIIKRYYWHGNLRELQNIIKRAVLMCTNNTIDENCLPIEIIENNTDYLSNTTTAPVTLKEVVEQAEKKAIEVTLKRTNNNRTETAKLLGIDRKTLYNKLNNYKLI